MRKIFLALPLLPLVSSCTLLASHIAVDPPGIATKDFRGCLAAHQFFDDQKALDPSPANKAGGALASDAKGRVEPSDTQFVIEATRIIYRGLLPTLSYQTPPGVVESPYQQKAGDWKLNRFLDCYIGEVGPAGKPAGADQAAIFDLEDKDVEGRLLRGHILLVLLAKYGVQLIVSHPSSKQVKQAELLLGHVIDAEKSLRSGSMVMSPDLVDKALDGAKADGFSPPFTLEPKPVAGAVPPKTAKDATALTYVAKPGEQQLTLRWYGAMTRVLRVFQVGVDDEQIDLEQTLDRASNLLQAFNTAFKGFVPILKDALSGLVTVQKTQIYGDAFLRDARETLAVHRSGVTYNGGAKTLRYSVATTRAGWKLWDVELDEACAVLATVAQKDKAAGNCSGTQAVAE